MTQETKQYVALTADEGKYITQASLEEGDERIFASRICTTDASAWTEWTQEQRDEWEEAIINEEEEDELQQQ